VAVQRSIDRAAGIDTVLTLDTDHSPFLSRPAEFATIVERFAAAVPSSMGSGAPRVSLT
jgi:hypothetical protein